jgi:hypothetical protein
MQLTTSSTSRTKTEVDQKQSRKLPDGGILTVRERAADLEGSRRPRNARCPMRPAGRAANALSFGMFAPRLPQYPPTPWTPALTRDDHSPFRRLSSGPLTP